MSILNFVIKDLNYTILSAISLLSILIISISCAKVEVYPVQNQYGSKGKILTASGPGVRFYRPALYVWITKVQPSYKVNTVNQQVKDGDKTTTTITSIAGTVYQAQFDWLPDFSQEYVIEWNAGIGGIKPKFTLENGWNLTAFNSEIDSGVPELINAVSGAVQNVAAAAAGALIADKNFKGPGLYKLNISADGKFSLGYQVLGLE